MTTVPTTQCLADAPLPADMSLFLDVKPIRPHVRSLVPGWGG